MARMKNPPRMAQPDLEPLFTPMPSSVKTLISDNKTLASKKISKEIGKSSIDNRIRSKLSIATKAEESLIAKNTPIAEQISEAKHGLTINSATNNTDLICPQCDSRLNGKGLKEFREHVESCTIATVGDSESIASSLSPPPDYLNADDYAESDADADDEDDYLKPYEKNGMTWYPESHVDSAVDDMIEGVDGQQKISLRKITDPSKFVDSLEDFDELSYQELYLRCQAAQQALVAWQNEFIDIDQYIRTTEPAAPGKEHKNPRLPKSHLTGVGYQDQLEAYAYGYEYNSHHSAVGNQNPLKQRITNAGSGGRELRQRVPTQKAAEADQSTTPDTEEGANGRRRGRAQKVIADGDPNSQTSRGRNTSRFNSESRGHTPQKTFPSGKTIGRPRIKGNKSAVASRLKEVQLDHDGSQNDSTPEPAQIEDGDFVVTRRNVATQLEQSLKQPSQTTEQWNDETEQEDVLLRPSTSDSTMTGNSTDDMRVQPVRSSTRNRKRANTSDFEDALPASKRFGRKLGNAQSTGLGRMATANVDADGNAAAINTSKRRTRLEESDEVDCLVRTDEPKFKKQRIIAKKNSEDMRTTSSITGDVGLSTAAESNSTNADTALANHDPTKKTGKDGSKPSRASLNMMRRWAAKKKAEALGLPVPKIGRYPKGGSAPSTPNVDEAPDLNDTSSNIGGRKRKRDDFEASSADMGDAVTFVIGGTTKGRGNKPKKITDEEAALTKSLANQENDMGSNVLDDAELDNSELKVDGTAAVQISKRKGHRPKKDLTPILPETQADFQTEVQSEVYPGNQEDIIGDADNAEYGQKGLAEEIVAPSVKSKSGHMRKTAATAPASMEETQQVSEEKELEGSSQPPVPRTSGRIRRPTPAAVSSQADTRPSSRGSKATVAPAPLLMSAPVSVQQSTVEPAIKQEPITGPLFLKNKQGRQVRSATTGIVAEPDHFPPRDTEVSLEPLAKRRRVAHGTKSVSIENTPISQNVPSHAQSRRESVASTEGAQIGSTLAETIETTQDIAFDTQLTKKKGSERRPRKALATGHTVDAKSSPELPTAAINFSGDIQDTSSDVPASNTRHGKGLRKVHIRRAQAEHVASDIQSSPEIVYGPVNALENTGDTSNTLQSKKDRSWHQPRKVATADTSAEEEESEVSLKEEVSPTKRKHLGRFGKKADAVEYGDIADIDEAADETSTRRGNVLGREETSESEVLADAPLMTRASRRARANSAQAASIAANKAVRKQAPKGRILKLKTNSRAISDAIATILGQPAQLTITQSKIRGTWDEKRSKVTPTLDIGLNNAAILESTRSAGIIGETEMRLNDFRPDDMRAISEPSKKPTTGRARGKKLASNTGGQSTVSASDLPETASKPVGLESAGDAVIKGSSAEQLPKGNSVRKGRQGGKNVDGRIGMNDMDVDDPENDDNALIAKVESEDGETSVPEMDAAAKKKEAARLSKAEKMRESMKRRWASGAMDAVMAKKKAENLARKAAISRTVDKTAAVDSAEERAVTAPGPASAPAKRKAAPIRKAARSLKRRRTMNATMDGAADEYDYDVNIASSPDSPTTSRKMSEYERFQELASPSHSPHSKRQRRPAALRASQSFGKFTDSNDEDEDGEDDDEDDVESEINKQFESEYDHFQALTSPVHIPGILVGKRKRKPVTKLEEAMRIEAGADDEDDFPNFAP